MNEQLFRKKSIDRVFSPEQLNEYIRVSNPSVWVILLSIVVLLIGVCAWGVLGHLDTVLITPAIAETDGQIKGYVNEADIDKVAVGMTVTVKEAQCTISEIKPQPVVVDESFMDYILHVGGLTQGEWVYEIVIEGEVPEGIYAAEIIVESVSPMSFVLN